MHDGIGFIRCAGFVGLETFINDECRMGRALGWMSRSSYRVRRTWGQGMLPGSDVGKPKRCPPGGAMVGRFDFALSRSGLRHRSHRCGLGM